MVTDLKFTLQFPSELDSFIFNNLEGIYSPDPNEAFKNKDAGLERQKINLGTYFPRSFTESYIIFKDLNTNECVKNIFEKDEFFILDIGGGVGGNVFGLLWFMKDQIKNFKNKKIHVVSLDCNNLALNIQKKIIQKFFINAKFYAKCTNLSCDNLNQTLKSISEDYENKFDIIMSFKFVNEFYRKWGDYQENKRMYKMITDTISDLLDENGIFILADTSDKMDYGTYLPQLMNGEVIGYLNSNTAKLKPIAPLSCAFWYMYCKEPYRCYSLSFFRLRTSKSNNVTKLSYKIFAHKATAKKILNLMEKQDCYCISDRNTCNKGSFKYQNCSPSIHKDAFHYRDKIKKR